MKYEIIRRQDLPADSWAPAHRAIADLIIAGPGAWLKFDPEGKKPGRTQHDLHQYAKRRGIKIETFSKRGIIYVNYIVPLHPLLVQKTLRIISKRKGVQQCPVSQETEVRGN